MGEDLVHVRYTKWGGGPHWHFILERLGFDRHGCWLAGRPGIPLQLRDEPPVYRRDWFVCLVPSGESWIAFWNERSRFEIYIDVTTAPVWSHGADEVTAVDLDLDVVRWRDGGVELLDEDEFLEHQVALAYPRPTIDGARAAAADLLRAVTDRQEPFGEAGARWLDLAVRDAHVRHTEL